MCCSLYDASEDQPVPVAPSTALAGTLVSSLHRLKDVDNNGKTLLWMVFSMAARYADMVDQFSDGAFFVFGDLSVKLEGEYRLKFTLFEMRK